MWPERNKAKKKKKEIEEGRRQQCHVNVSSQTVAWSTHCPVGEYNRVAELRHICHCHHNGLNDIYRCRRVHVLISWEIRIHLASSVLISSQCLHMVQMKRTGWENPIETGRLFLDSISVSSLFLVTAILKGGRQLVAWKMYSIIRNDQRLHRREREGWEDKAGSLHTYVILQHSGILLLCCIILSFVCLYFFVRRLKHQNTLHLSQQTCTV